MAEFLVYDKDQHLDKYSPASISLMSDNMQLAYNRRYQRGNIIQVREDGYYRQFDNSEEDKNRKGWNRKAFSVISVPIKLKDAEQYVCPVIDTVEINSKSYNTITKKSAYKIRLDLLGVTNKYFKVASLEDAHIEAV